MSSIACMISRGRAHDAIVAELVDQINAEDSVQTFAVEPYKVIEGSSATHKIDVYWEFLAGAQTHRCAIEARHWDKPVSLRALGKLRKVLSDLPDPPTGILLASSGFKKGARAYAEHHGIDVWIYPFTIETMNDDVTFFVAKFEHVSPVFDEDWIEKVLKPKLREGVPVPVNLEGTDERTHLFDEHCAAMTVRQVLHEYHLAEMTEMPAHEICVLFDKPTYIETGDLAAPILKVSGLNAVFSMTSHTETLRRVSKDYARRAVEFIADVLINER
ncbi:MAG: restriction endonuclease [Halobacteriota archaeon]